MRPGAWLLPLFVHAFGAMVLVGAAVTGVRAAFVAEGGVADWSRRLSFRVLLLAVLPAFVVMRIGAEWIRIEEFGAAGSPGWVELGYVTADGGAFLVAVSVVLAWRAARRGSRRLALVSAMMMAAAVVVWLVTAWAMTAKPDV
jgi:hypothetical protein